MKVVLDLKGNPTENDVIVYKNGQWTVINRIALVDETFREIKKLSDRIDDVDSKLVSVDNKLKEYHDVLQVLTEGGNE